MNELMIKNIAHTVGNMKDTMSSLEIAKLTGKEHKHVLRDIREFLDEIDEGDRSRFGSIYKDAYGREQSCFILPKRECLGLASKYDAKLRMAIIDRWAELEHREQQANKVSPRQSAVSEFEFEVNAISNVLAKLGYSQGYLRKEAIEIGFRIEGETGERVIPTVLLEDPEALQPDKSLSQYTGTHAAMVAIGSRGYSASNIAHLFGKAITATEINRILCECGFQKKLTSGKYQPTESGKLLCNQRKLASGRFKGQDVITEWLYASNKSLRDVIDEGVKKILTYKEMLDK